VIPRGAARAWLAHPAVRAATWPARRAAHRLARLRARPVYGLARPGGWPPGWPWPFGPSHPHDGERVVVAVGGRRYEFLPVTWMGYRGHVHQGTLRPDAADLAGRLARLGLPADAAAPLASVSAFEGGFDSIQTFDRSKFTWGFVQFAATGGLPRLLQNIKTLGPRVFRDCFVAHGIDVERGRLAVRTSRSVLRGAAAWNRLHDEPRLWTPFLLASREPAVQDLQVRTAYEGYYAHMLAQPIRLAAGRVTLGVLFAGDEYGRAVVLDRAVHRGVGHAVRLFHTAARRAGARGVADAPRVLAAVRALEAVDGARLDALATAFRERRA
jgi:hypothetical protein